MITIEVKDRKVLDTLNQLARGIAHTAPLMTDVP